MSRNRNTLQNRELITINASSAAADIDLAFAEELKRRVLTGGRVWKEWGEIARCDHNHLRRVFNSSDIRKILKMDEAKRIRLAAAVDLARDVFGGEQSNGWNTLPAVVSVYEALSRRVAFRQSWLTYTKCLFTFCVGEAMRVWFNTLRFTEQGFTQDQIAYRLFSQKVTHNEMLVRHIKGSLLHRILLQRKHFERAIETDPEIVRGAIVALKDLDGCVVLHIADEKEWIMAKRRMKSICGISDCCSLSVIDEQIVLYRPECAGEHLVSDQPGVVSMCADGIEQAMELIPQYSLKPSLAYLEQMLASRNRKSRPR